MAKAAILTLDDEIQVLNAIERDLLAQYSKDYRILKASSGAEGLEIVQTLKRRNDPVALFLVDQRMPNMTGTEFLDKAREFYPEARQVLLTAYADTQVAIDSINSIGLDYYLLKPWDPPDQLLYPILDEVLADWVASVDLPYEGIRMVGTLWSARSHSTKDFLARNRVPFQWLDLEKQSDGKLLIDSITEEKVELPVVFFTDGSYLMAPDNLALAQKIGIRTEASENHYDLIIVGGGPAGLGAAVYGASEGLRTLMIEREATGGQAGTSSRIENYLGFPKGISGSDLARRATDQAARLGSEILTAREATKVRVEENYKIVTLDNGEELSCLALLLATGVTLRELNVPGVRELHGAGVYYGAALTEAAHYAGRDVVVVGGANSAGQGAVWLSQFAKHVTILARNSQLSMSKYLIDQIALMKNIDIQQRKVVQEVRGDGRLQAVVVRDLNSAQTEEVAAAAMFIFIGARAHTDIVRGLVETNPQGFILTGPDLKKNGAWPKSWPLKRDPFLLETNVPGIFAAGDIRHSAVRRVASAVGQGAIAISEIHQYLRTV